MSRYACAVVAAACTACSPPPSTPPAPPETAPLFRDVAVETGIAFRHFLGATEEMYFPGAAGPGAALVDFDNDGDLDIYVVQGTKLGPAPLRFPPPAEHWPGDRLFRNELIGEGRLRFTDVTEQFGIKSIGYGMGVATADYDGDGDWDLYVTRFGSNALLRNDGDRFVDVTAAAGADEPRWSTSASFFDYDGDGWLDLYVANYVEYDVAGNKPCFAASGARDYCGPQVYPPATDTLFRNRGDGTFENVGAKAGVAGLPGPGLGVIGADFNGDALPDIYVANDQSANFLWINQGDGTFVEDGGMRGAAFNANGSPEASMGVTAADYDSDGDLDLFMTHLDGQTNTLYINDGQGQFVDQTARLGLGSSSLPFTGFGTEWFDFDNDGLLDLFVANGAVIAIPARMDMSEYPYEQRNQLFRQYPAGRFEELRDSLGPAFANLAVSRGAAFGDVDNDGDIDIVVTNNNGPLELLRNDATAGNHWLGLRLVARGPNRDALGANVAVHRDGAPPLWRRVHTDGSYLSANDVRLHFGLGDRTDIAWVEVHWPGGSKERFDGIATDRYAIVREGDGRTP